MTSKLSYKQGAVVLGIIVITVLVASEIGGLSNTRFGTILWLTGLLILAIVSPAWGFCLGRCYQGRGHEPFNPFGQNRIRR